MSSNGSKGRRVVAFIVAIVLCVGGGLAYTNGFWPFERAQAGSANDTPSSTHDINKKGGTFTFPGGVKVTVPKGAVTDTTTLTVGSPVALDEDAHAPFSGVRKSAVRFDVSLSRGAKRNIQPQKPLEMSVSLVETWRPGGAVAGDAKVYTPLKDQFWMVPAKLAGTKLTMSLGHLSPKYITYVSDQELLAAFDKDKVEQDRSACKQQVAVEGGKVKFGSASRGWSLENDSPLFACLSNGKPGYVRANVVNRIGYIVSIAATSDVRVAASTGSAEVEVVKSITRHVFPTKKAKALLGEGDKMVGSVRVSDLPATVEAVADPGTFFAESTYRLLGLTTSILTGKSGSETIKLINTLMTSTDVVTCFQSVADDLGENLNMGDIVGGGLTCTGTVIGALSQFFGLGDLWARAGLLIDAVKGIKDTAVSSWNGIRLTLGNTIRVPIVAEMDLNLDGFTGEWFVHGSSMMVNADGTGSSKWNAGPCEDDLTAGMCTGYSTLAFKPMENGFRVTRTAVWYETDSGERYTPASVREYGDFQKVGDTTVFTRVSDTAIKTPSSGGDGFGNPYMCRSDGPEMDSGTCGA